MAMTDKALHRRGLVEKGFTPDEGDLALINEQAITPLSIENVYAFKVNACGNAIDRHSERFDDAFLAKMAQAFKGCTIVKDHYWTADNQFARIYDAYVEEVPDAGDGCTKSLVVKGYMLRNEANANMIAEINAGIKREVSVSLGITEAICSVCGTNRVAEWCSHRPGKSYDNGTCTLILGGECDAYELSFVAVPAQPGAGVAKGYLAPEPEDAPELDDGTEPAQGEEPGREDKAASAPTDADLRLEEASLYMQTL